MGQIVISVCVPCYNEESNVELMYEAIKAQFLNQEKYVYEIVFCDNCSTDNSQQILRKIANKDKNVKVIFNNRNFGPMRNSAYIMYQATGDAIIGMPCDFQEPPEMIPEFIEKWSSGYKVVMGQKTKSEESLFMFKIRALYYDIIEKCSDIPQFKQVTGFGIFDKEVINMIESLNEPQPNFRNIIAELGYPTLLLPYKQAKRKRGKSGYSFFSYFNLALETLINTSKIPLRMATTIGFICSGISFCIGIIYLVYKLIYWDSFSAGMAPVMIGLFFIGSIQLFFIGIIGEYIGGILTRVTKRPLVVERERINFESNEKD